LTFEKNKKKYPEILKNLILFAIVIALTAVPLIFIKNGQFSGSDDKAEKAIAEVKADYKPWFGSLWKPPSKEIESLLFALQAALGAGFIGYYIGYVRGKARGKSENTPDKP
jgi:cobalt/nickel transport protein